MLTAGRACDQDRALVRVTPPLRASSRTHRGETGGADRHRPAGVQPGRQWHATSTAGGHNRPSIFADPSRSTPPCHGGNSRGWPISTRPARSMPRHQRPLAHDLALAGDREVVLIVQAGIFHRAASSPSATVSQLPHRPRTRPEFPGSCARRSDSSWQRRYRSVDNLPPEIERPIQYRGRKYTPTGVQVSRSSATW